MNYLVSAVGGGAIARIDLTDQEIENFVENLEHCKSYQMCCILNRSCYFVVTLILKKNCNFLSFDVLLYIVNLLKITSSDFF